MVMVHAIANRDIEEETILGYLGGIPRAGDELQLQLVDIERGGRTGERADVGENLDLAGELTGVEMPCAKIGPRARRRLEVSDPWGSRTGGTGRQM